MARSLLGGCELYRLYTHEDVLLYVGVSENLVERLRTHSHKPPNGRAWWTEVAYCTLEHFARPCDALAAERVAIRTEWPAFNVRSARRGA